MRRLRILPLALALSAFFVLSYVVSLLLDLIIPSAEWDYHRFWEMVLYGFTGLSWSSFFVGLVVLIVYAFYVALVFVPIYNFFKSGRLPAAN